MKSTRIASLDGLRAVSIALVITNHIARGFTDYSGHNDSGPDLVRFLHLGHLGVMMFFVISGFLITTLLLKEDRVNLGRFYFRRTIRIFPPFYIYLAFILLLKLAGVLLTSRFNLFAATSYTTNFCFGCTEEGSWFTGHTWSLAIEEQFYLLWPPVLWFAGRARSMWVAVGVLAVCPIIRVVVILIHPETSAEFFAFSTVADSLAAGCVLAMLRPRLHKNRIYASLITSRFIGAAPFLALMIFWAGEFISPPIKPAFALVAVSVLNLCMVLTIDWCITNPAGAIVRVLNTQPIVFVGTISYSLYLWQQPFLFSGLHGPIWNFPLNIACIGFAAVASFYLIEKPSLRMRQRLEDLHTIQRY